MKGCYMTDDEGTAMRCGTERIRVRRVRINCAFAACWRERLALATLAPTLPTRPPSA